MSEMALFSKQGDFGPAQAIPCALIAEGEATHTRIVARILTQESRVTITLDEIIFYARIGVKGSSLETLSRETI